MKVSLVEEGRLDMRANRLIGGTQRNWLETDWPWVSWRTGSRSWKGSINRSRWSDLDCQWSSWNRRDA